MYEHDYINNTKLLPILKHAKDIYLNWYVYYQSLPKLHRYSLGQKIDGIFSEIIELLASAGFVKQPEKQHFINIAIRKLDTLKIFIMILMDCFGFGMKQNGKIKMKLIF